MKTRLLSPRNYLDQIITLLTEAREIIEIYWFVIICIGMLTTDSSIVRIAYILAFSIIIGFILQCSINDDTQTPLIYTCSCIIVVLAIWFVVQSPQAMLNYILISSYFCRIITRRYLPKIRHTYWMLSICSILSFIIIIASFIRH